MSATEPGAADWRDRTLRAHFQMLAASFALAQDAAAELVTASQEEAARARYTRVAGPLAPYTHRIDRLVRYLRESAHVLSSLEHELFGHLIDEPPPPA